MWCETVSSFFLPTDIEEIGAALGEVADEFAGTTLVLAGGCGFLGRYVAGVFDHLNRHRLSEPCRLVLVDNLITSGDAGLSFADAPMRRFVQHDVSRPLELDGPIDFVVNAAGIASPKYYRAYPLETLDAAISGNRNLLQLAARHGARYTFFSSSEIYGDPPPEHLPTPETYRGNVAPQGERACYDEGKRVGETLCWVFNHYFGVATTVIRPFNVYGPGMQENDYRVLPSFASSIKAGRPLQVYGSGGQTRTFCYVTDALNGFLRVIARGASGETYNVGNPEPEIGMTELVARIEGVLGRPVAHELCRYPDSYPADEPLRRCPDVTKARDHLGFRPQVGLDRGLARFLSWADSAYTGAPSAAPGAGPPADAATGSRSR